MSTSDKMDVETGASSETQPTSVSSTSAKSSQPRFEVKKWNAVALWSWDTQIDNCAICRNHIMVNI